MKIAIIGIGNAGICMLNKVIRANTGELNYLALDTDGADLEAAMSSEKLLLPAALEMKPGYPLIPQIGQIGIYEKKEALAQKLNGTGKAILLAGMGGNCATGAVVELAKVLEDLDVEVAAIVTTPLVFEGSERQRIAEEGVRNLQKILAHVTVISLEDVKKSLEGKVTFARVFEASDEAALESLQAYIKSAE